MKRLPYINFLNRVGTYWDLLVLDELIKLYQGQMVNNIDEKGVYENLKNSRDSYQKQKDMILGNNTMEDIKEEILSRCDLIFNYLIENTKELDTLYSSKRANRRLPLYAIFQEIVKKDMDFYDIYRLFIQNNLYNPNLEYGVSDEPFFTLLPIEPINLFYQTNQMVIANSKTDFHISRNGSDAIENALYHLSNSKNQMVRDYWEDYIMTSITGNCSLLDSRRYHRTFFYEVTPSIFHVMSHLELQKIRDYLLSEQGIYKQIENAIYPSLERDKAIDFYVEQIKDSSMQKRLQQLKRGKG